ncbi:MAG: c-type cytochrome biogenesis protein CcmI [Methyloceanibacter sp.]
MFLWFVLAALTATVLYVLLRPLVAARSEARAPEAFDAAIYRDQLAEIESDRARGLLGEGEAEAARIEIARRLLAADEKARASDRTASQSGMAKAAIVAIGLALPLASLGLYLTYGSPRLPDQPLAARLGDPANEENIAALVARVEARLRAHPEEGEGWEAIAPVYLRSGRYSDAAEAYARAIALRGPSAKLLAGQGQALVLANNGLVTKEAREALEAALERDGSLLEPRILIAIAKEQDGQYGKAVEDWRALLADAAEDAPWRAMAEKRLQAAEAQLAGTASGAGASPPAQAEAEGAKGPTSADIEAAQNMDPAERQAMIERMVQGLAARLDEGGGRLNDWLTLVRAYTVLDRKDDAVKALDRAKSQFSGDAPALEQLDRLADELGLKS